MEPEFEVSFYADKRIFREFGELHAAKTKRRFLMTVCGFLFMVCAGFLFLLSRYEPGILLLVMGILVLLVGQFFGYVLGADSYKNADKTFAGQPVTYRFDESYFYSLSQTQTAATSYDGITDVVESDRLFALYVGKGAAHVFPKDAFIIGSADLFRAFIAKHTSRPIRFITTGQGFRNRVLCLSAAVIVLAASIAGPAAYAEYRQHASVILTEDNYAITVAGRFYENPDSPYDLEVYGEAGIGVLAYHYTQEDMQYFYDGQASIDEYLRELTEALEDIQQVEYGTLPSGVPYSTHYWTDARGTVNFYMNCLNKAVDGSCWFTRIYCPREKRGEYEEAFLSWLDSIVVQ